MVDRGSQPTCFRTNIFLQKQSPLRIPRDKADYTKIKIQFKGVLDQEDFQKYVIGAFDRSEQGKTGAIHLILPKILVRVMEQYHFIKTVLNYEDAYLPDGPFFVNMDGKQVKTDNINKVVVAKRMAAFMGLPIVMITQNRHAVVLQQRAVKATGDTGLGNSRSTIELYYDDHLEAQGIGSKSLANAHIMENVASEGAHGEDDAFYSEKAVKDNELAKRTVKKNLTPSHLLKIFAGWRQEMPEVKFNPRRGSNFA
jgi:hypothetical protein